MFDKFGQPYGYGQIAPGRDIPKPPDQQQQQSQAAPLQQAIASGAPQYPTDPSFTAWRQRPQPRSLDDPNNGASSVMPGSSPFVNSQPNNISTQPLARAIAQPPVAAQDPALAPPSQGGLGAAPFTPGGSHQDPAYVDSFIAHMGQQPGVNPSVKNDPNYWKGKISSGELGTDQNYWSQKMMTPEGAPAGGQQHFNPLMSAISGNQQQDQQASDQQHTYLQQLLASLQQPQHV